MNREVNVIANRLSLRPPQRESLEILDRVCDIIPLEKSADIVQTLQVIQSEFPSVSDFERDFPSFWGIVGSGSIFKRLQDRSRNGRYLWEYESGDLQPLWTKGKGKT
jgi:hypothetical protein